MITMERTTALHNLSGLTLGAAYPHDRIALFIHRAGREIGFARRMLTPDGPEKWPERETDISALLDGIIALLPDHESVTDILTLKRHNDECEAAQQLRLGLLSGWLCAAEALADGIPSDLADRIMWRELRAAREAAR